MLTAKSRMDRCGRWVCAMLAGVLVPCTLANAADEPTAQAVVERPQAKPLDVTVGSIQTQRVIWHGRKSGKPSSTTLRDGPPLVCAPLTASVANNFNGFGGSSSARMELGLIQGEGLGSSYTFPSAAFPIEITLFETWFASVAPVTTSTGWQLDVYDGLPTAGPPVFTVVSDPDPPSSGLPGDVVITPAAANCNQTSGANASAVKLQFSVDETADPSDRMIVNNTSGTGIITVVVRVIRANNPGSGCAMLDACSNAFLIVEGQGEVLNFPNDNWLYAVSCSGGAPPGFTRFGNLSTTFRPSADVLQQITFVPTDCGAIPSGACCMPSGVCSILTGQSCFAQNSIYRGDGSTCANASCPQPTGACCLPFGGCDLRSQTGCQGLNGVYKGATSVCQSVQCADPSGACCALSICVGVLSMTTCVSLGGSFEGNATTCFNGTTCPLGACCLADGSCAAGVSQPACAMTNGTFKGINVTCAAAACPPPNGACCTAAGPCVIVTQTQCTTFVGNVWKGALSVCGPSTCPSAGVCCRGVTCSTSITQAQCTGANNAWVSQASQACNVAGNVKTPCCRTDFNKVGGVSVQDLFDFLAAYFAKDPIANFTGNGAGAPTVQSIFDYLAAYFMGQCV